jgi:hypothetical protein
MSISAVLSFERFGFWRFSFEVGVDLCPVGVVISKSCVNLRQ